MRSPPHPAPPASGRAGSPAQTRRGLASLPVAAVQSGSPGRARVAGTSTCRSDCRTRTGRAGVRSRSTDRTSPTPLFENVPAGWMCLCHRPQATQGCASATPVLSWHIRHRRSGARVEFGVAQSQTPSSVAGAPDLATRSQCRPGDPTRRPARAGTTATSCTQPPGLTRPYLPTTPDACPCRHLGRQAARSRGRRYPAGSRTRRSVSPGRVSMLISPRCRSTMRREMSSPRPVPSPTPLVV